MPFYERMGKKPLLTLLFSLKTIQDPETAWQKRSILDVHCKCKNGTYFIVEMQVDKPVEFIKRAQFYASRAYVNQMHKGGDYEDLKEVVFLAFLDSTMFPDKTDWISHHQTLDIKTHERDLKDFSYTFVELKKFHKAMQELNGEDELWTLFFQKGERLSDEEYTEYKKLPIFEKTLGLMNKGSLSEEEFRNYEAAEKAMMDNASVLKQKFREGKEEGREEGERAKAIEVARNLLAIGLSDEQIITATGLSQEEIESLK